MDHAIHAADVHKHAVAGHGLDGTGVVLAHLDVVPDLSLGSGTGLIGHGLDGTHHAAAGTVDLGDAQGDSLADHLAELSATGQAALGSGNEHTDTLDVDDDTALVLLGDLALNGGLVLGILGNILPDLHGVQTLFGQLGIAVHVVDADDEQLDLVANLDDVLRLHVGVGGQLFDINITCLLSAEVDLHFGGADGGHNTGYLVSCI